MVPLAGPDRGQRAGQPGGRPFADALEPAAHDGIKQAQRPPQPDVGVIADRGALAVGCHGDPVGGLEQRARGVKDHLPMRDVLGDLIRQRHAAAEKGHRETEPRPGPHRARIQLLTSQHAWVPLGRVAEGGQVVECVAG